MNGRNYGSRRIEKLWQENGSHLKLYSSFLFTIHEVLISVFCMISFRNSFVLFFKREQTTSEIENILHSFIPDFDLY